MAIQNLLTRQAVITRRDSSLTEDEFGNEVPDEVDVETVCEAQPRRSDEAEDQGTVPQWDWKAYFLPADSVNLDAAAKVWIDGLGTFEVVGPPNPRRNPRTQEEMFCEANLRRTAGVDEGVGS